MRLFCEAVWPWAATSLPKLGELPMKQGLWTSCPLESFPFHGGSSPRTQHRKAGLCPQKLPAHGNSKVAEVLGAQLQGDFHSRPCFRAPGLADERQSYIISRQRPHFSFGSHGFSPNFTLHRFLPHPTSLTEPPDCNVDGSCLGFC